MTRRLFISYFENEKDILNATNAARENNYKILDVYTPYAVHGMDEAMGLKPSKLPWICLALGLFGAIAKLWYQVWTSATSWPVNVGGKPLSSIPAFVPVTFEVMVLFAGVGTVLTFFIISKLRPGKKPKALYPKVTDNRFALVLVQSDARFDIDEAKKIFSSFNAVEYEEKLEKEEN
ncbi:MAG: DUF3341 domain-containing protein [Bacteroidetes bacterium]|nr:DUF3341 domain-containing protein [Bacteroidota bacterium]MBU2586053.1 DUF3341 domain-containing protein [Bacteroidota bacterium]